MLMINLRVIDHESLCCAITSDIDQIYCTRHATPLSFLMSGLLGILIKSHRFFTFFYMTDRHSCTDKFIRYKHTQSRSRISGFTLIELMVTVAILGILAAIAYPNYVDYVIRSRLTEATSALATSQVRMEQYYMDYRNYAASGTTCGYVPDTIDAFSFSCSATSSTYTVTATGIDGMAGFGLSIDQDNTKKTTAVPAGWQQPAGDCWINRKNGSC